MIAMELDGRHIGKNVRITYRKSVKSKNDTVVEVKVQYVHHTRTRVDLKRSRWVYSNKLGYGSYAGGVIVPTLAEVEVLD
jgi:hypothetical protein